MSSNEKLIQEYIDFYKHSKCSQKMRKSCLKYLFGNEYFNFTKSIFKIDKATILNYFIFLKNLNNVSVITRKNKWCIFRSFLGHLMYLYDDFLVKIPPPRMTSFRNAIPQKEKPKSKRIKITQKDVIKQILQHFKEKNLKWYLFFRLTALGARKGEILNLKCSDVNTKERYIHPREGKTGEKYYFYDQQLAESLELYLKERFDLNTELDYLFLTNKLQRYDDKRFNVILKTGCEQIGLKRHITIQTFRATINNLRKDMNCPLEDRKLLLGHALNDVNVQFYTDHNIKKHRTIADRWNPYKDMAL